MGYFRFCAAFAVAINHLWNVKGGASVYCFYLLTGFLITELRSTSDVKGYRDDIAFIANRLLRIYPTYYACLAIGIAILHVIGHHGLHLNKAFYFPKHSRLKQYTIFGLAFWESLPLHRRILPSAWSLNVILVYYPAIWFVASRSLKSSLLFMLVSLLTVKYIFYPNYDHSMIYFSILGAAPVFALGAIYHHLQKYIPDYHVPYALANKLLLILLFNALLYLPSFVIFPVLEKKYLIASLSGLIIIALYRLEKMHPTSKLDHWLGSISYPLFLLHWPVSAFVASYILHSSQLSGHLFFTTLAICIILSIFIIILIEYPLKRLRTSLARKHARTA